MKSLYDILEDPNNRLNPFYNGFMLIIIFMSLLSLLFKNEYKVLTYIDYITVSIFIIDSVGCVLFGIALVIGQDTNNKDSTINIVALMCFIEYLKSLAAYLLYY